MNKENILETLIGAVVLLVAAYFLHYAYTTTQVITGDHQYVLFAKFDKVDGINLGGDVRISGIKVGKVTSQILDPKTFQAVLGFSIKPEIKLPVDTSAEIVGNGLLGDKYVALVPGSDGEVLKNKDYIEYTQSSISLESLIGKFMFGVDKDKKKDEIKSSSDNIKSSESTNSSTNSNSTNATQAQ
jgi:phospholipid/cholesterol/gamma-HCH transport system substrate-binding protein